jgi:hypothetical protein
MNALRRRYGHTATGNFRVDAFLDGDHFAVTCKKGQAPRAAVAQSLKRRLGVDVQLWPVEATPAGEMFRAQWYDASAETYREGRVEIWNVYRRAP